MVNHDNPEIDLTADEHDGEPAAQRARVEEPDHLLCPITRVMFRDPVVLLESGHTYEREAIERHLREHGTDPLTRDRIRGAPVTNRGMRNVVQAWLDENPGVTPDGWDTREMLSPSIYSGDDHEGFFHVPDVVVLCRWRESHPGLRREWAGNDPAHWHGIYWENGRVVGVGFGEEGGCGGFDGEYDALEGPLPCLQGLTSLRWVRFIPHCLSGTIPENIFQGLPSLVDIWIDTSVSFSDGNYLCGPIPEKLLQGGLTRLEYFSLSRNKLSGQIPQKLFYGLHSLRTIALDDNQLSGSIPEKLLHGLASLEDVSLQENQLSGAIPEKLFEGLTSLQKVHLQRNQLTGSIPEKLFEGLTSLRVVDLSNNRLSGPIPTNLFDGLTSLQKVDLSGNDVTGPIPDRLREVVKL